MGGILGTSVGGNDAVDFFDVGVVNHKVLNGIALENGRTYYATVIGTWKACQNLANI